MSECVCLVAALGLGQGGVSLSLRRLQAAGCEVSESRKPGFELVVLKTCTDSEPLATSTGAERESERERERERLADMMCSR